MLDFSLLRCPKCKGDLEWPTDNARCTNCASLYPQMNSIAPRLRVNAQAANWDEMQEECDAWYKRLLDDPDEARKYYEKLFVPFKDFIIPLRGKVLDIGGGNGLVRQHLDTSVDYLSLDPSSFWFDIKWKVLHQAFPFLEQSLPLVDAEAEHLPFPDAQFDAITSFWSMNHLSRPAEAMDEIYRCLKSDGLVVLVLEYMEPRFFDIDYFNHISNRQGFKSLLSVIKRKTFSGLRIRPWPVPSDHTRIGEREIKAWTRGRFKIANRAWADGSLFFVLRKI